MHDVETFDISVIGVDDQFGPREWFSSESSRQPLPYIVTRITDTHVIYTHPEWERIGLKESISKGRFNTDSYFKRYAMRCKNRYMEYDPAQQGDTDEDI